MRSYDTFSGFSHTLRHIRQMHETSTLYYVDEWHIKLLVCTLESWPDKDELEKSAKLRLITKMCEELCRGGSQPIKNII